MSFIPPPELQSGRLFSTAQIAFIIGFVLVGMGFIFMLA